MIYVSRGNNEIIELYFSKPPIKMLILNMVKL